jgi:hypothetical protein
VSTSGLEYASLNGDATSGKPLNVSRTPLRTITSLPKDQPEQRSENADRDGASDEEVDRREVGALGLAARRT